MNTLDLVACGVVWRNYGKEEAGRELVRALKDPDAAVRELARTLLTDAGERSLALLQHALVGGELTAAEAAWCLTPAPNAAQTTVTWDAERISHGCADNEAPANKPLVQFPHNK